MNYLDLFSGIGGFALATKWAGLQFAHHFYSDIDTFANSIYAKHNPDAVALGDIHNINGRRLAKEFGKDWLITGGFPCQSVSAAGKREGFKELNKSGLWFEYARIIKEIKPRFVLIENVRGLLSLGFDQVLCDLSDMGYDAEWSVIRACDVGLCHNRQRVWIVAYPHSKRFTKPTEPHQIRRDLGHNWQPDGAIDRIAVQAEWTEIKAKRSFRGQRLVSRVADGIPGELHTEYTKRVRALGNSIVPQIAAEILARLPI